MLLWILIITASVILDQVTKLIVVNTMEYGQSIVLIKKIFSFQYIHNYGAAWGMFSDHRWVFMVITSLALIAMPIILYRYRKLHFLFGLSLSLFIGGAIGNMIDRIFLGYVVDFLQFTFIDFPIFNVADICVVFGAIIMMIYVIFFDKELFVDKKQTLQTAEEVKIADDGTNQENVDNGNG
ncbi:MAG: signal peptidase II [Clostridia bacterium]|nr:signal peptidase II [Clostridia bacterium]